MCDDISTHLQAAGLSRRSVLRRLGLAAAGAAGAIALPGAPASAASAAERPSRNTTAAPARTRLVLLGTAGGPVALDGARAGIGSVVVFNGRQYLVDLGIGTMEKLTQSGLAPSQDRGTILTNVEGIFFTHLHSDHFMDWPAIWMTGTINASGRNTPIMVFGPGDRGSLVPVFGAGRNPDVIEADDPTPGITTMTRYLQKAFAQDLNDRVRDSALTPPSELFHLNDIDLGGIWEKVDSEGKPPRVAPFPIWEDGDVQVSATLVDHHPTAPAFAFRFDTPGGSIVFSGDTAVSENLIELAHGADYLVHEVIDRLWVEDFVSTLPPGPARDGLRQHLLGSHTTIDDVGPKVAEPAGVKNLVLSHIAPANCPENRLRAAGKGYSGKLIVGTDLLSLNVGD